MMHLKETVYLGVWNLDLSTLTIEFNLNKALCIGYDESEIPRPTSYEFFTEKIYIEDSSKVRDAMLALIQGEMDRYDVEYRIRTKSGGFKWFRETCEVVAYNDHGKSITATGKTYDITQSKGIEDIDQRPSGMRWLDDLTQVLNRNAILDKLKEEIQIAEVDAKFLTIAILTVPNFFELNGLEGRAFGDHLLKRIADIIKSQQEAFFAENHDKIGRCAINAFLLIFSDAPNVIAEKMCEAIKEEIGNYDYGLTDEKSKRLIQIQYGIAEYLGETAEALIEKAKNNARDEY
ncbi:MAG TPA: hypothetical protein DCS67_10210 [Clostridiales bacterium UBA8960]|nr:hypothetical protein [Clostridiales bacterium UBA8960]